MFRTAFLALLAGCATSSELYLPDGRQGYAVSCDGNLVWDEVTWEACYKKASQICGDKGYEVAQTGDREMLIACGNPATP